MKKYTVSIYETLVCDVEVEANSKDEAEQIAAERWGNGEYMYEEQFHDSMEYVALEND